MKKTAYFTFACLLLLVACKKNNSLPEQHNSVPVFPLTATNQWAYVDSFFDSEGRYYGFDTFTLKPAKTIVQNNHIYTPITDQYDEAVFTIRYQDSSVYILEPPGEALMFNLPMPANQPYISNSYYGDTLHSIIYTNKIKTMGYPSYKIIITQDDGLWRDYKSEELYFSVGLGIIKGGTKRKNNNGDFYTSDSYRLFYYYVN